MMNEDYNEKKQCRIAAAKQRFNHVFAGFMVRKNGPLKAVFDQK